MCTLANGFPVGTRMFPGQTKRRRAESQASHYSLGTTSEAGASSRTSTSTITRAKRREVRFCPFCGDKRISGAIVCHHCGQAYGQPGTAIPQAATAAAAQACKYSHAPAGRPKNAGNVDSDESDKKTSDSKGPIELEPNPTGRPGSAGPGLRSALKPKSVQMRRVAWDI